MVGESQNATVIIGIFSSRPLQGVQKLPRVLQGTFPSYLERAVGALLPLSLPPLGLRRMGGRRRRRSGIYSSKRLERPLLSFPTLLPPPLFRSGFSGEEVLQREYWFLGNGIQQRRYVRPSASSLQEEDIGESIRASWGQTSAQPFLPFPVFSSIAKDSVDLQPFLEKSASPSHR